MLEFKQKTEGPTNNKIVLEFPCFICETINTINKNELIYNNCSQGKLIKNNTNNQIIKHYYCKNCQSVILKLRNRERKRNEYYG